MWKNIITITKQITKKYSYTQEKQLYLAGRAHKKTISGGSII